MTYVLWLIVAAPTAGMLGSLVASVVSDRVRNGEWLWRRP